MECSAKLPFLVTSGPNLCGMLHRGWVRLMEFKTDYNTFEISQWVFCQEIYDVAVNVVLFIDIGHYAAIS